LEQAMGKITAILMTVVTTMALVASPSLSAAPAGERAGCLDLRLPTAAPFGTSSCPGVRPGALTLIPSEGVSCSLGFLFRDGKGANYMTTAGHCAAAEGKQHVWSAGKGPVASDSTGKPFGRFVFAAHRGAYDIAIIAVNRGVKVNAAMCHFGGPTGTTTSRAGGLATIEHYGNAGVISDVLPARTGLSTGLKDAWETPVLLASFKGDSGGPVVLAADGKALGYVTTIGVGVNSNSGSILAAPTFVTRLGPQMALASKVLKRTFTLRTAAHSSASISLP
jgi:hypothetical protein